MDITSFAAVVTGAASGLGTATATELARRGATVYGLDLPRSIESATVQKPVHLIAADVTSDAEVSAAIAQAAAWSQPLRIAVNCAGIAPAHRILGKNGPHNLELFRTAITTNLLGTFNVMRLAAEAISTTTPDDPGNPGSSSTPPPSPPSTGRLIQNAYTGSKGGVAAMTIAAARDLAQHGIRVNTIAPGIIDTPMLATVSEEFRGTLSSGIPFPRRRAQPTE